MRPLATVTVWFALLLLFGVELLFASIPALRGVPPFIGMAMAALVALTFMRLGSSRGLEPVFAVAGLFWLCIMIGLGTMDPFTRREVFSIFPHQPAAESAQP